MNVCFASAPVARVALVPSSSARRPAMASCRAAIKVQAQKSEYGLDIPTNRAEPPISNTSIDENKAEARTWISSWKARKSGKPAAAASVAPAQKKEESKEEVDPRIAKGQLTAIWTGAFSIALGLAYFALVFFLDSRGGELLPPPPEAFGP